MTKSEKSPGPTGELVKAAADNDLQKAEELLSEENLQASGECFWQEFVYISKI